MVLKCECEFCVLENKSTLESLLTEDNSSLEPSAYMS